MQARPLKTRYYRHFLIISTLCYIFYASPSALSNEDPSKFCRPSNLPAVDINFLRFDLYAERIRQMNSLARSLMANIQDTSYALDVVRSSPWVREAFLQQIAELFDLTIYWFDRNFSKFTQDLADPSGEKIIKPYFVKERVLDIGSGEGRYWNEIRSDIDQDGALKELWGLDPFTTLEITEADQWAGYIREPLLDFTSSPRAAQFQNTFDAIVSVYYFSYLIEQASTRGRFSDLCQSIRRHFNPATQSFFDSLLTEFKEQNSDTLQKSLLAAISLLKPGGTFYIGTMRDHPQVRKTLQQALRPWLHNTYARHAYEDLRIDLNIVPFKVKEPVAEYQAQLPHLSNEDIARLNNAPLTDDGTHIIVTELHIIITRKE